MARRQPLDRGVEFIIGCITTGCRAHIPTQTPYLSRQTTQGTSPAIAKIASKSPLSLSAPNRRYRCELSPYQLQRSSATQQLVGDGARILRASGSWLGVLGIGKFQTRHAPRASWLATRPMNRCTPFCRKYLSPRSGTSLTIIQQAI